MQFKSIAELQEFCRYIENSTRLFEMDYLGYPWYYVVKQSLWNSIPGRAHMPSSDSDKALRLADFNAKLPLLGERFDYAFIVKSKMRRREPDQVENLLFKDIFDYLASEGRRFVIFEEPSGSEYDTRYLKSGFCDVTLPLEHLLPAFKSSLQPLAGEVKGQWTRAVEQLFACHNPSVSPAQQIEPLRKAYLQRSWQTSHILLMKILLQNLGVKALIGGMGTHLSAGLDNRFAAVEVGHGYPGANRVIASDSPVCGYLRNHFPLQNFYTLAPSPTEESGIGELCCPAENLFNYGMPEVRAYRHSEVQHSRIRKRYDLFDHPAALIITSGWIDYSAFEELLREIRSRIPRLKLLLRPHPAYDHDYTKVVRDDGELLHLVGSENLFDLISIADVVVSVPSSVVVEASQFTENIIVLVDNNYTFPNDAQFWAREYPFAATLSIEDRDRIVEHVHLSLSNPVRKDYRNHPVEVRTELKRLFDALEKRAQVVGSSQ